MIRIQKLNKSLHGGGQKVNIINDLDLHIPAGQFIAITGPSGSGKSTLLGLMAGLDSPTNGDVFLDGKDLTQLDENQLARLRGQKVGIIFQSFYLIPTLTAHENVSIPSELSSGNHSEEKAKEINKYRIKDNKQKQTPLILANKESAFDNSSAPKELAIIIKADVHGSSEALKNAIEKIKHAEVTPKIILSNIGVITETDIMLAKASGAILIGFNVRPNKEAKKLAEKEKINLRFFNIIYEALDFINDSLSGLLKPNVKEEIVGSAEVKEIFKVSKIGKVAGSKVLEGEIINNLNARLIRDGNVLYTGTIGSIFREKNAAKQVAAGLECGITLKDFTDFKAKDVIEVYQVIETERRI